MKGGKIMEFEYSGTIYFDTDELYERCLLDSNNNKDLYEIVNEYVEEQDDSFYYGVEGWMIDMVVTALKNKLDANEIL